MDGNYVSKTLLWKLPSGASGKESACQCRRHRFDPWVGEDPPEEGLATQARIHAWRIPWTEEPGGLQSIGLQRVRHEATYHAPHCYKDSHSVQQPGMSAGEASSPSTRCGKAEEAAVDTLTLPCPLTLGREAARGEL